MASKTSVEILDDIDGSSDAGTVAFGFEGINYEVDLAKKNRAKLEKALAPFIEAGRKVSAQPRRGSRRGTSASSVDRSEVRAWAKAEGLKVSERGRISAAVMEKYSAGH
jgi:Lsr2